MCTELKDSRRQCVLFVFLLFFHIFSSYLSRWKSHVVLQRDPLEINESYLIGPTAHTQSNPDREARRTQLAKRLLEKMGDKEVEEVELAPFNSGDKNNLLDDLNIYSILSSSSFVKDFW